MKIILTEDTGIGFEFIKIMAEAVFGNQVLVINSAYGNGRLRTGGYSNIQSALNMFLKNNKVDTNNDQIYIIYDDFSLDPSIPTGVKLALVREISKCETTLNNLGIAYKIRPCTCFEEAVISFKLLSTVCDPLGMNRRTPEGTKVIEIQRKIWGNGSNKMGMPNLYGRDYSKALRNLSGAGYRSATSEGIIKELLDRFMTRANFPNFSIKPSTNYLGQCWRLGCQAAKSSQNCSVCKAKQLRNLIRDPSLARDRLILFYKHSLFRSLF